MRAVAVTPGKGLDSASVVELPAPTVGGGLVLVRVLEVGLDATDREVAEGTYGAPPPGEEFLIPGHESLGRVVEVGRGVQGLGPGDLVVATVRRPDQCPNCQRGQEDRCLYGSYTECGIRGRHGFLRELYTEEPRFLIQVPPALEGTAVLLEPLSIAEKAVAQAFRIQQRMFWEPARALVLGVGPLGVLAALALRLRGLAVAAYALEPPKSLPARLLGEARVEYLAASDHPLTSLPEVLGPLDLVLEMTGSSQVAFQAMGVLGVNGVLVLASVTGGQRRAEVPVDALNQRMVLGNRVVFGTVSSSREDFVQGLQDMEQMEARWPGLLPRLVTRRLPLERFAEALQDSQEGIKTVVVVAS